MNLEYLSEEEKFLVAQDEKLDIWFNDYKNFEKLKFNKAKDKYIQMSMSDNLIEKKELRDEIICGTMYKIYEFLKEKKFIQLCSDECDIDDIIDEFTCKWISAIDNGYFCKKASYYSFFISFVPDFTQKSINNCIFRNNTKITISNFIKLLKIFNIESNTKDVTLNDFIIILIQLLEKTNYDSIDIADIIKENKYVIVILYKLIYDINQTYDNIKNLYNDVMLENYIMALIKKSDSVFKENLKKVEYHTNYDNIELKIVIKDLLDRAVTNKQKIIIEKIYGINNMNKETMNEIAEVNGNTKSSVSQSHVIALKRLRKKLNSKKNSGLYF